MKIKKNEKKMTLEIKAKYIIIVGLKTLAKEAAKENNWNEANKLTKQVKELYKDFWNDINKEGGFGIKETIQYSFTENTACSIFEESIFSKDSLIMNLKTIMLPFREECKATFNYESALELLPTSIQMLIDMYENN